MIPQPIDTIPLFQRLSEEERRMVVTRLKRRQALPGELIFSAGQPGHTLFILTAGWVKIEGLDQTNILASLGAGSLLGEADVFQERPYSMSARSAANTQLLTLTLTDLQDLINERPSIGLKFSASAGVRIACLEKYLVQQRLRNIELLTALAEPDLRAIARRLDFRLIQRGDLVIEADAPGDAAFFIEQGSVRLMTKTTEGEAFEDLEPGALFGHTALLTGKPYGSTGRAVSDVMLWVLPRNVYRDLIGEYPAIKLALSRSLAEALSQRDQSAAAERMRGMQLFSDVPPDALSALAARLVLRHFPADEAVYTEGTPGDALYVVESGEVKLFDSMFSDSRLLERVRAGEMFGEMALLTGRTRAECARAATDATMWVLYKSDFDDVMVQFPSISVSLSRALTERLSARESDLVTRHLHRMKLLADLSGSELKGVSKRVRSLRFRPGEIICFTGQPAQTLFMVEKGQVKRMLAGANGEPIMLDIMDVGDSFGEQDIVQNAAYGATAQAMIDTELWTIGKGDFLALMEEYPALAITVTRRMAERLSHTQRIPQPLPGRPRGGMPVAPRPGMNVPPPTSRVQRPPSGARLVKPATPTAPLASQKRNAPVAPKPTPLVTPLPSARPAPAQPKPAAAPKPIAQAQAIQPAPILAPKPIAQPHAVKPAPAQPKSFFALKPIAQPQAIKPAPAQPKSFFAPKPIAQPHAAKPAPVPARPRAHRSGNSFFQELGTWARGLSLGAKLRIVTLGMLAVWFVVVALPWMTITTVSSAVGGLQLFNPPTNAAGATANTAGTITNSANTPADRPSATVRGTLPNSSAPKVAFAVPTNTPVPTRTPLPTFTPRPKPTLAPVTRTPVPPTVAPVAAAPVVPALPPASIDPRLVEGSPQALQLITKFKIIPANVGHGQKFWRITQVKFEDISESGSDHTIYVKIFDENGKRTEAKLKAWGEGSGDMQDPEQKKADDMCNCNYGIGMWGDGYGIQIVDQYPSDQATGMIMPMRRHVNYKITYQLVTNP